MARKYTEEECIKYIEEAQPPLYNKNFINWNGVTENTGKDYQEVFSTYIYERLDNNALPGITKLDFDHYCKNDRKPDKRGQDEEKVQREFYNGRRTLDKKFGESVWYELRTNKNGKGVDLVFYNENTNDFTIFELKYHSGETLLRAVLELQTYYQSIQWEKALAELREKTNGKIPDDLNKIHIKKCILINKECDAYKTYHAVKEKEDSSLKKLLDAFDMEVVVY